MTDNGKQQQVRTRVARGRRPQFLEHSESDKLLAMIVALTGEVAVLRERLDTYERLAAEGKLPDPSAIEAFEPDETLEYEREHDRQSLLSRVFRVIEAAPDEDPDGIEQAFQQLVDEADER